MSDLYPALRYLGGCYLHQDFREEYATPDAAVDDFLREAPTLAADVRAEVERALATTATEEGARTLVLEELDSYYLVEADGLTYRGWLQSISDRARDLGY